MSGYRVTIGQESTGDLITECEFDTKDQALAYLESAIRDDLGKPGAFLRPTLRASRSIRMVMDGYFMELSPVTEPDSGATQPVSAVDTWTGASRSGTTLNEVTQMLCDIDASFGTEVSDEKVELGFRSDGPHDSLILVFRSDGSFESFKKPE